MLDQANQLRRLVLAGGRGRVEHSREAPRIVAIAGGKGGVGTTTVAVNLAIAMARDGRRVLLVDADLEGADAAMLCGLEERDTLMDVLAGRRSLHEVIQRGPAGIQVVPGAWGRGQACDVSSTAQDRLLDELTRLGPYSDFVILDAGNGANRVSQRFWQAASQIVLVTTPEPLAVMDAYAAVKVQLAETVLPPVFSLVNLAPDDPFVAADVHERIARACQRFLGIEVHVAGELAADAQIAAAASEGRPVLVDFPTGSAATQLEHVAARLVSPLAANRAFEDVRHAVVA